jgi:small-conductance mechanosensitive channel
MRDLLLSPLVQIIVLGIAGIVVWHLQGRGRPNARLVVQIAFFAAMTAALLRGGILPHEFQPIRQGGYVLVAAKLLWWVHLAWAATGFVRIYIVLDRRPHEARLLQDLIVAAVYLGVALSILAFVFGIAIGALVATSGVIAIILGLALQSTLNDVFSGLALTLGRPYGIGDWIMLSDGTEGRVVENTWRSTHILTGTNNIVVLPNSFLAKIGLTNVSRPDETHLVSLPLRLKPTHEPFFIVEALQQAMMASNHIIRHQSSVVAVKQIDAIAMEVALYFRVEHPLQRTAARNEIVDLVYRQCAAIGLQLALPAAAIVQESAASEPRPAKTFKDLLMTNPVFEGLNEDDLEILANGAKLGRYHPEAVLLDHPDGMPALMIVRWGAAVVLHDGQEGPRLASGAMAGRIGRDGAGLTFKSLTALEAYEIDGAVLASFLADHAAVQSGLSQYLSQLSPHASPTGTGGTARTGQAPAFFRTVHNPFRK